MGWYAYADDHGSEVPFVNCGCSGVDAEASMSSNVGASCADSNCEGDSVAIDCRRGPASAEKPVADVEKIDGEKRELARRRWRRSGERLLCARAGAGCVRTGRPLRSCLEEEKLQGEEARSAMSTPSVLDYTT